MTTNPSESDRAWAYVHHEMDEAERQAFEQRLRKNAALAEEVAARRRMDAGMRVLAPLTESEEAILEDQVLEAWETLHRPERPAGRLLPWPLLWTAAAAAACLVILAGIYLAQPPPLSWARPTLGVLTYRGDEPGQGARYEERDLRRFHDLVKHTISDEYEHLGESGKTGEAAVRYELQGELQEFHGGVLSVTIQAHRTDSVDGAMEWSRRFGPDAVLDADLAAWSHEVAAEMYGVASAVP